MSCIRDHNFPNNYTTSRYITATAQNVHARRAVQTNSLLPYKNVFDMIFVHLLNENHTQGGSVVSFDMSSLIVKLRNQFLGHFGSSLS